MCLLSPPTPLPTTRVLTDSAQQATLASGQVQDFSRGPSFNTKEQLMEGFKIRHLFIGDRKRETQRSGELGLSPLRILMLRTRYGKCVDGLRTEGSASCWTQYRFSRCRGDWSFGEQSL